MITAPLAGMMLADLGAEVDQGRAPAGRRPVPQLPRRPLQRRISSPTTAASAAIKLDLRSDAGRDALLKLLARADVLIENYRAGVMTTARPRARRCLSAANPTLIHCSITGLRRSMAPTATGRPTTCVGLAL